MLVEGGGVVRWVTFDLGLGLVVEVVVAAVVVAGSSGSSIDYSCSSGIGGPVPKESAASAASSLRLYKALLDSGDSGREGVGAADLPRPEPSRRRDTWRAVPLLLGVGVVARVSSLEDGTSTNCARLPELSWVL